MVTLKNIRQVFLDGKKYTIAESYRLIDGELILTVIEAVAAQTLDPNSKISRNQAAAFGLQRRR